MESIASLLEKHHLFDGLDQEAVYLFAGCAEEVSFDPGERIYQQGDEADRFYILCSGEAALESETPGRGKIVVETLSAGDVLGASWLFPPYRLMWDARARSRVRAVGFNARCLRLTCDENPQLGYLLMKRFAQIMIHRMQAARLQSLDIYGPPAKGGTP